MAEEDNKEGCSKWVERTDSRARKPKAIKVFDKDGDRSNNHVRGTKLVCVAVTSKCSFLVCLSLGPTPASKRAGGAVL